MLPFGHVGIGTRLASPWSRRLPSWPLYLGTLVPDLIDKPAYFIACAVTGQRGEAAGLISGTRTFGHTLLLTAAIALAGLAGRSGVLKALSLGMLTHLVLDVVADGLSAFVGPPAPAGSIPGIAAVLWPALGLHFPNGLAATTDDYARLTLNPVNLTCEVIGAALLLQRWIASRPGRKLSASA